MALTIFLQVLKIIGIALLCIIGLIILIVLLVLFVPIRYDVRFARTGIEDDPPVDARAVVSWLLHVVHVSARYPERDGRYVVVRVFGIPVVKIPLTEEEKAKAEERKRKKKEKKKQKGDAEESAEGADSPDEEGEGTETKDEDGEGSDIKNDNGEGSEAKNNNGEGSEEKNDNGEMSENAGADESEGDASEPDLNEIEAELEGLDDEDVAPEEKKSIFSRIADLVRKMVCTIRSTCDKIKSTVGDFADKAGRIKKDVHYYHAILTSELFERTLEKTKKRLTRLLKGMAPRKCDIGMEVGFDDPYVTGEVMAIAGILYPITGDHVRIVPHFDEEIIRGAGRIKGRIFIISIVIIGLAYLMDKDFRKLIRLLKKEPPKSGHKGRAGKAKKEEVING